MASTSKNKTVIIIAGPTAVGKTAVAIELAKYFKTEIISADSRQCFKEMKIGVARPSESELKSVQHHFIASHSIHEEVNAAGFEQYALEKTNELFQKYDVVIMVGGTGLYIKVFCEGMDDMPPVKSEVRSTISTKYKEEGLEWLQKEVQQKDPEFFKKGEIQNPQRLMRALEVVESTGASILNFRKGVKAKRDFNILKIALTIPKEELHNRINARVDQMMKNGLLEEVKSLITQKHINALQTVGYKELFSCLENEISLEEAVEQIKKNTRQYAKRQMTWFKKDKDFVWFSPKDPRHIIKFCEE